MRSDMRAACGPETVAFETVCTGTVLLRQEHWDTAAGDDKDERLDDILAEARIGCSQKCNCLNAAAWLADGPDGVHVVARCAKAPGELELGHRDVPEPDGRPR